MATTPKNIGEQLATLYTWALPSSIPSPIFRNDKIPRGLTNFLWDIFQVAKGHPGVRIRFKNDAEWTPVLPDFKIGLEDNGITVEDVIEEGGHTVFILRWTPGSLDRVPEISDMSPGAEERLER